MAEVWSLDGPSSKVSPTYPLQVAACAGAVTRAEAVVLAMAVATTASPVIRVRSDRWGSVLIGGASFSCWQGRRDQVGMVGDRGQLGLQETVGQVQLPLVWMVTPQLLPLPLGLATSCCALG